MPAKEGNIITSIPPEIKFFRSFADLLSEPFLLITSDGCVLAANRSGARLFAEQDLAGAKLESLFSDPPAKISRAVRIWSETGSLTPVGLTQRDRTILRCDGARLAATTPALIVLRCVPRSESIATREFVRHSSEYMSFQKNIAEKLAAAKQQKEAAETTAAIFAHEVANPLNGIATCLDVLQLELDKAPRGEVVPELLAGAKEEIARLTAVLNDFRSIARPQVYDFRPVDLGKAVRELLASDLPRSAIPGVEYDLDFASDLPPARADKNRLKQAIRNLCKNAIDAMPNGGQIRIAAAARDGVILLEISDTGNGVPPGVDPFQLFKTTKAQGSGLGLPVAAQIIASHKGRIEYRTLPGRGTVFTVHLPVAHD